MTVAAPALLAGLSSDAVGTIQNLSEPCIRASQHRVAFLLERGLLTPGPYTLAHAVAERQGAALSLRSMLAAQPASLKVMAVH